MLSTLLWWWTQQHQKFFLKKTLEPWFEPGAAGSGSKYANYCAMIPPFANLLINYFTSLLLSNCLQLIIAFVCKFELFLINHYSIKLTHCVMTIISGIFLKSVVIGILIKRSTAATAISLGRVGNGAGWGATMSLNNPDSLSLAAWGCSRKRSSAGPEVK